MKKILLTLSAAALVLASCAKIETVKVDENRAIEFSSFVGNNTKAVEATTTTNLEKFYVFGNYGTGTWTPIFTNVEVTKQSEQWIPTLTAYWEAEQTYSFGAYSDGNAQIASNYVSFIPNDKKLTFTDYQVRTSDLIASIPANITSRPTGEDNDPVSLSFQHLLSRVKFTFNNTDAHDYTMAINDIKVAGAVKVATCTYTYAEDGNTILWEEKSKGEYSFGSLTDIAQPVNSDGSTHSVELFVIPQSNESLTVTFTAVFSDGSGKLEEKQFTGSLKYDASGNAQGTETGKWTPGFMYNYNVTINGNTVSEDKEIIDFTVTVGDWTDAASDGITIDPTPQQ